MYKHVFYLPSYAQLPHTMQMHAVVSLLKGCRVKSWAVRPSVWVGGQLDPRWMKIHSYDETGKGQGCFSPFLLAFLIQNRETQIFLRGGWLLANSNICKVMSAMYSDCYGSVCPQGVWLFSSHCYEEEYVCRKNLGTSSEFSHFPLWNPRF